MKYVHYFGLLLSLTLLSCAKNLPVEPNHPNKQQWAVEIDQQANLYRVDHKLFRSEQLLEGHYPLLAQQGIKTIVNLRYFDRNDDQQAFAHTPLHLINTPLLTWHITPKELANVLWQIEKNQSKGAVLVHCYHGADRTGLVVAMYRVIYQHWSLAEAKQEMMAGPYGFHSMWKNIESFLTAENVNEVKRYLHQYSQVNK